MSDTALPKRKLIEVALPLEVINRESAREKSIRHGHPSTLHLWWSRKPLATARAVLFAQLVDDPSSHPDKFPTEELVVAERRRLHQLLERLVVWENSSDEALFAEAHREILASTDGNPPPILDPFAGGGSIPLEAQRLGLEAHASDLNPVAVLINKALIEIPPKFAGRPPVFPGAAGSIDYWPRATGLAEDVRRYGQWMRDEAEKRIGHLYPKAVLPDGSEATVIAWIWARTVTCPNPACGIQMPLTSKWWLGKKKGKEAWVKPSVVDGRVNFDISHGTVGAPTAENDGTVGRTGARCINCGAAVELNYIRAEGRAGRLGAQLMSTVAEGKRTRVYLSPDNEHVVAANVPLPAAVPEGELFDWPGRINVVRYGMTRFADLFTSRQLTALTTFSDLVLNARQKVLEDIGLSEFRQESDLDTSRTAYADAVATYLGLGVSRAVDRSSTISSWDGSSAKVRNAFARQAIPMTWDFAEVNPFSSSTGNFLSQINWTSESAAAAPRGPVGRVAQAGAGQSNLVGLMSTDPPYYDNIGYSDLSDFFYVWLRRSLAFVHPALLGTLLVPKAEELVANPYRHGGRLNAQQFFEAGFVEVFRRARLNALPDCPITIYYAFKQAETTGAGGEASTGWETFLTGMIGSGWTITATWPMRSELGNRMLSQGTNALASSIVLALRPRPEDAPRIDRRRFAGILKAELPQALRELLQGAVAPVDLPQAAIGPGMAVFSRYSAVVEDDGSTMSVRTALARINEILDEVLHEQEGEFDQITRFALAWFRQNGFTAGDFGSADSLANARNASLTYIERSGILTSRAGKVTLLAPASLPVDYDPATDEIVSHWELVLHLVRVLSDQGIPAASLLLGRVPGSVDRSLCKELAFLLFTIAEDRKMTKVAVDFNALGTAWNDIESGSRGTGNRTATVQAGFDYAAADDEDL